MTASSDDVRMRGFRRRADLEDVHAWIDARTASLPAESAPLEALAGRILAEDLVSGVDVPGFDRAAMDGWAVRGEETFGATETDALALRVVGVSRPGAPHEGRLAHGEAVRIMTGAPIPEGADAVLRAEDGQEADGRVEVRAAVPPARHVGRRGEDVAKGRRLLATGRRLRPQDVGLASSVGRATLEVVRRPRVELLLTGDELLPPGTAPSGAHIPDSNAPMLAALVARDGALLSASRRLPDLRDAVAAALRSAEGDVVLVSGGSSVGEEDHAPGVLAELGELAYHGVALRPAAPTGLGRIGERVVFLLPGNPVSCLSAYDLLAGRAVRRLGGRPVALPYPKVSGRLQRKIASVLGRVDYVRVRIDGDRIDPVMSRGASILSSTTEADGFVLVPRDAEGWPEGHVVEAYAYDGL